MAKNKPSIVLFQLGPLRLLLMSAAVLAVAFATPPATAAVYSGWALVPTVLVPVLVPLVFLMLVFDSIMSGVFMIDKGGAARARYKTAIILNLALVLLVLIRWLPYYRAL